MGLFKRETNKLTAAVIICCAGLSTRMKGIDKISYELFSLPVWARATLAFERAESVSNIILVVKEEDISSFLEVTRQLGFQKVSLVVRGGETRQESVFNGFKEVLKMEKKPDIICIHDGARPFIKTETIEEAIWDAHIYGGSCVCLKSRDTVKVVGENGFIEETLDRNKIYLAQTPQCFNFSLYEKAVNLAKEEGKNYTDDCQLFEAMGAKIHITEGDSQNIKITSPEDLKIAEGILSEEEF